MFPIIFAILIICIVGGAAADKMINSHKYKKH